jgi:hypothetical protein
LLTNPVAPPPDPEQTAPQAKLGGQHPPPTLLSQVFHPPAGQGPVLKVDEATTALVMIPVVTYVEPPVRPPIGTAIETPLETIVVEEAAGQLDMAQLFPIWQQPGR